MGMFLIEKYKINATFSVLVSSFYRDPKKEREMKLNNKISLNYFCEGRSKKALFDIFIVAIFAVFFMLNASPALAEEFVLSDCKIGLNVNAEGECCTFSCYSCLSINDSTNDVFVGAGIERNMSCECLNEKKQLVNTCYDIDTSIWDD